MRPLRLAERVGLVAGLSVLAVFSAYAVALHHSVRRAVVTWEREDLSALAHHAAEMLASVPPAAREDEAAQLTQQLSGFGLELQLAKPAGASTGGGVRIPIRGSGYALHLSRAMPAAEVLLARIARIEVLLGASVIGVLLVAVQGSVYWGLVRPLRTVHQQLNLMKRGPWTTRATADGVGEVVALAQEVQLVGTTLDHRISQWVAAERRGAAEAARLAVRAAALPHAREVNLIAGELLVRQSVDADAIRLVRKLQKAADRLIAVYSAPRVEGDSVRRHGVDVKYEKETKQ